MRGILVIILRFEWLNFIRNPIFLISLFVYILMGSYGIYFGQSLVKKQLQAIDSVKFSSNKDYTNALKAFQDTCTAEKKKQAAHAGNPYLIDYRIPRIAIYYPKPLAGLSTGLRDITPISEKICYSFSYSEVAQEITNPVILYEGSFDLTFNMIYLLPLIVIIFSYNLLSVEKEQGTYTLLLTQGISVQSLIMGKLVFRFLAIGIVTFFLNLFGIITSPQAGNDISDNILWLIVVFSYLVFWLSVVYFVIIRNKSSILNAIFLLGIWLLTLFMFPALIKATTALSYPLPLRTDIDDMERHVGEDIWFSPPSHVVQAFFSAHPQYINAFEAADTTNNQNDAFFAGYHYLKKIKMSDYVHKIERENDKANSLARKLILFSPGQQTQAVLNSIAGTGRSDYLYYKEEVAAFQKQWAKCFYDRIFYTNGKKRQVKYFVPEELNSLIVFKKNRQPTKVIDVIFSCMSLWIITIINILIAFFLRIKIN